MYSKCNHDAKWSVGVPNPNESAWIKDDRIGFNVNQGDHGVKGFMLNAAYTF